MITLKIYKYQKKRLGNKNTNIIQFMRNLKDFIRNVN